MKNLVREEISINVEVMDMLNEQIAKEALASGTYLAMASWCDQRGYVNSAKFYYDQAVEEREHMMKIFNFINDCGGAAYSPEVKGIQHEYSSLRDTFEQSLGHEVAVTKSIYKIIAKCRKVEDFASENFLQWFVSEQLGEERSIRDILDIFDIMGEEGIALKLIDERIK